MSKVIETFLEKKEPDKPITSFKIARSIGSCIPDAGEVVKMIALLTSVGRIESVNGKWKKISESSETSPITTGFRMYYIKKMMKILEALPEEFVTLNEFVKENNLEIEETESILFFLKDITQYGQIYLYRKFPQKWAFRTWE
jgi:hypothetical protein